MAKPIKRPPDPLAGTDLRKQEKLLQHRHANYKVTTSMDDRHFIEVTGEVAGRFVMEYDKKGTYVKTITVTKPLNTEGSGADKASS